LTAAGVATVVAVLPLCDERDDDRRRHSDTAHTPMNEAAIVLTA
jgi:hypothetical protein